MADTEKEMKVQNFKARWEKLSDAEKLYVYRNVKNLGDDDRLSLLKHAISNRGEMKRLAYYSATGESIHLDEGKLPIDFSDRALVQNLARDPNVGAKHLAKKYPQYEFKNYYGEIVGRTKGTEEKFLPLDPPGFGEDSFADKVAEGVQDTTDVVWPAARAVGETAASIGGGLAGGLAGSLAGPVAGGAGALTGSTIAGAETAGFLEEAGTGLGRYLGIDQEKATPQEIADAKKFGFMASMLGGSGATLKSSIKLANSTLGRKTASRLGMNVNELGEQIYRSQSGAPVKMGQFAQDTAFGPMAGNTMREQAILRQHMGSIKKMEELGDPLFDVYSSLRSKFESSINQVRKRVGKI